jgi:small subunit ribosomal protein S6
MRKYELMTIHRPGLDEDEVRSRVAELESYLGESGAQVKDTDLWGKRRLAYEIDHTTEGYYTVLAFDAEPEVVEALDRRLSLSDEVLRHKVFRPDS